MRPVQQMTPTEILQRYPEGREVLERYGLLDDQGLPLEHLCRRRGLHTLAVVKELVRAAAPRIEARKEFRIGQRVIGLRDVCRWYVRSALIFFVLGSTLGLTLAIPATRDWWFRVSLGRVTLAHAHLQLLGFMTMLIYGVGYQIIPRLSARGSIRSPRIALAQWVLANAGVLGMALAFSVAPFYPALPAFAAAAWLGAVLFAVNLL